MENNVHKRKTQDLRLTGEMRVKTAEPLNMRSTDSFSDETFVESSWYLLRMWICRQVHIAGFNLL